MAPRSENFQDQSHSRAFKDSQTALDRVLENLNEPQNPELLYVPVATMLDNPNNMAINLDHSYYINNHPNNYPDQNRFNEDNLDVFETYDDLIIPYQNRLLTIHQDQGIADHTQISELTLIMHQRVASNQVNFGTLSETIQVTGTTSRSLYLFKLNFIVDTNLESLLSAYDEPEDLSKMALLSDFLENEHNSLQSNLDTFRSLVDISGFQGSSSFLGKDRIHSCDEYGHPELVGCDPFFCSSRQIFDMNYESPTLSSLDDPLKLNDLLHNLHIDSLSDMVRTGHFYVSFLFYPLGEGCKSPLVTSLILIEDLKRFCYNVIPKFPANEDSSLEPRQYRIFCILTELDETENDGNLNADDRVSTELVLHQGLLHIKETPIMKLL